MVAISVDSSASVEAIARYINANFKTDKDKISAFLYWTTSSISYDVANIFTLDFDETEQGKITKTLRTKKAFIVITLPFLMRFLRKLEWNLI
jgi:hypothetical protein